MKPVKNHLSKAILIFVFAAIAGFQGCASTPDTLDLDSVMNLKADKEARQEAEALRLEEESREWQALEKKRDDSELSVPEAEWFELPASLRMLREAELIELRTHHPDVVPESAGIVWRDDATDVTLVMGRTDLDWSRVNSSSPLEFRKFLDSIVSVYVGYYSQFPQSVTETEIDEIRSMYKIQVMSRFVKDEVPTTQHRLFYLYTRSYRLSLMVSGPLRGVESHMPAIEEALELLETRLLHFYPDGLEIG